MASELRDNAERTTASDPEPAAGLHPSDSEMQAFFSQSGRSSVPKPTSLDFGNPTDIYGKDNVITQNYQDMRQSGLGTDIVRMTDLSAADHPYWGREASETNKISAARWNEAYNLYPELASAGLTNGSATELSKAIIRNELHHYDSWDRADDTAARLTGYPLPRHDKGESTLGYSQLSPNSIKKRCDEFPQLREYLTQHGYPPGSEMKVLANPEMAPVLIAANLAHNIRMYERHGLPVNERTLAYGFNPDEKNSQGAKILLPDEAILNKSQHVSNVMFQLELLRKGQ